VVEGADTLGPGEPGEGNGAIFYFVHGTKPVRAIWAVDPEAATVRAATPNFTRRFGASTAALTGAGKTPKDSGS